jgi:hypothetical protein
MENWRKKAEEMFFNDGLEINDIAVLLDKSRRSIQGYLSTCTAYEHEKEKRSTAKREKRKEYKRQWDRDNRNKSDKVTAESMRREHDIAAMILSHEKY